MSGRSGMPMMRWYLGDRLFCFFLAGLGGFFLLQLIIFLVVVERFQGCLVFRWLRGIGFGLVDRVVQLRF